MSDCLQPHGILQARILEWMAVPFSRGSSQPRVSCIAGGFFTTELAGKPYGRREGVKRRGRRGMGKGAREGGKERGKRRKQMWSLP